MQKDSLRKNIEIRKAKVGDIPGIYKLINTYASKGELLRRSPLEIYENIRDYTVVVDGNKVIGVASLHFWWPDMAELRSLVVRKKYRGKGIGRLLVENIIEEGRAFGVSRIFVLTRIGSFFEKFGFKKVNKDIFPRKIWNECVNCPKFLKCDEEAYIKDI